MHHFVVYTFVGLYTDYPEMAEWDLLVFKVAYDFENVENRRGQSLCVSVCPLSAIPRKGLVYMTIASLTILTFIQGHKCVSNWTTFFNLQYLGQYLSYYTQTWR